MATYEAGTRTAVANTWYIDIENIQAATFRSISSLSDTTDYHFDTRVMAKGKTSSVPIPGATRYGQITLDGLATTNGKVLWDWVASILKGDFDKPKMQNQITLTLKAPNNEVLAKFNVIKAWPCAYSGSSVSAGATGFAIETLTIVFENYYRET